MPSDIIIAIVASCLGSTGLFAFIQFLISRQDKKKNDLSRIVESMNDINSKLQKAEKDSCRTQMLVLMADYPTNELEILTVAEHYFEDLEGDWYLTSLFKKYLRERNLPTPTWFRGGTDE